MAPYLGRSGSSLAQRQRWAQHAAADADGPAEAPGVEYVMLRQRVAQAMDSTGWGTVIVMLDVFFSVVSVGLYIAMTYHPLNVLYHVDLALACLFAINWLFWLWIAEDRLRYVFSFFSAVDAVTIIPSFILYGMEGAVTRAIPGLNFLRVLRILRVLRVFRMKHIMRRHLEGAVMEAAGKLVFTLLSILFIAAGLYYELEKWGPDHKKAASLTFVDSIYWASVTLTTVGYGDQAPTWWPTQLMLIALLGLTFTVLPYLTGQLMEALTRTSPYQRKRYKPGRRPEATHVVFLGSIDGPTMSGLLNELYHEDKGFNRQHSVFLSPRPPSFDVQHLLASHSASSKLVYLQGSPFRFEDLRRSALEYSTAVFIIGPKYAEDATLADRHTGMIALSVGQYLQEAHVTLRERLSHGPNRAMHWLLHGKTAPPSMLPSIYLQLTLPEGRLRLFQVLQSLQDSIVHSDPAARAAAAAADALERAEGEAEMGEHDEPPLAATSSAGGSNGADSAAGGKRGAAAASPFSAAADLYASLDAAQLAAGKQPGGAGAGAGASGGGHAGSERTPSLSSGRSFWAAAALRHATSSQQQGAAAAVQAGRQVPTGCAFWRAYSSCIHVLCLGELKHALMAHTLVGVPGAITLLSNLSTTVDFGLDQMPKGASMPPWMRDYMIGASQEIYQLAHFPDTLVGRTFRDAAGFIFDSCHAVLLAVECRHGHGRHRVIVGDLDQVIAADMRGYIIADDVSSVLVVCAAASGDFEIWQEIRAQHMDSSQQQPPSPPPPPCAAEEALTALQATRRQGSHRWSSRSGDAPAQAAGASPEAGGRGGRRARQQQWEQGPRTSDVAALMARAKQQLQHEQQQALKAQRHAARRLRGSAGGRPPSGAGSSVQAAPAGAAVVAAAGPAAGAAAAAAARPAAGPAAGPEPGHRERGGHHHHHHRWRSTLMHSSSIELPHTSAEGRGRLVAAHHTRRASFQAVDSGLLVQEELPAPDDLAGPAAAQPSAVTAAAASAAVAAVAATGAAGTARRSAPGHTSALAALIHLLRSPSRELRGYGEAFLRQHYHMRPPGVVQSPDAIVVDELPRLSGHLLVVGVPSSQESLLSLLAPLRSRRLTCWRPVVIIDRATPDAGGCWHTLAQFSDVYFVQVLAGLNDALLRASAEKAQQAILMTPLTARDDETEDSALASKVMTDAMVLNLYQLLKGLNPRMEVVAEMMLPQSMAYLAPTCPLRGVGREYAHLLAPAYVSGSVFNARLLDDVMVASYCNNASDRIVLQLLHRWHMGWAGDIGAGGPQQEQGQQQQQAQQQAQQQQQQQRQLQQLNGDIEQGPIDQAAATAAAAADGAAGSAGIQAGAQQRVQFAPEWVKAPELPDKRTVVAAAEETATSGVPTLLQIPVEARPGLTYGRLFHSLLQTRNLLLLGLHRLVHQDGLDFRATLTNCSYRMELQPGDHAFVVARLHFPASADDAAGIAAAWPPDALGFSRPEAPLPREPDLLVQALMFNPDATPVPDAASDGGTNFSLSRASSRSFGPSQHEEPAAEPGAHVPQQADGTVPGAAANAEQAAHCTSWPLPSLVLQQQQQQQEQQQQQSEPTGWSRSSTEAAAAAAAAPVEAGAGSWSAAPPASAASGGQQQPSAPASRHGSVSSVASAIMRAAPPASRRGSLAPPGSRAASCDADGLMAPAAPTCDTHAPAGAASRLGLAGPGANNAGQPEHRLVVKLPAFTTTVPAGGAAAPAAPQAGGAPSAGGRTGSGHAGTPGAPAAAGEHL